VKFAFCIGSYGLPHFVELNIRWLRRIFGDETPILVSDDKSGTSGAIQEIAERYECHYYVGDVRRGHFAGDLQSLINALAFARQEGAEIAVKISQRLIITHPKIEEIVSCYFEKPDMAVALPGRPAQKTIIGGGGFAYFPFLTDVVFVRASALDPDELRRKYEGRLLSKFYHDSLVEFMINDLLLGELLGRYVCCNELTDPQPNSPRLYLRRYQNPANQYAEAASIVGLPRRVFELQEWRALEPKYDPRARR
jgi:hypothetical protein